MMNYVYERVMINAKIIREMRKDFEEFEEY
jgi:hypothetical protein